MPVGEERDAFTGVYRTNDPIQNLKIRYVSRLFKVIFEVMKNGDICPVINSLL